MTPAYTISQLVAMGSPLRIVDGDLYLDMDDEYDVEDDVIFICKVMRTVPCTTTLV